jgi:hypothetical protein
MASVTVFDSVRCAIVMFNDELQMNEVGDSWCNDGSLSVRNDGDRWRLEVSRYEDEAHLYATPDQMRSLRDWLNKYLKD